MSLTGGENMPLYQDTRSNSSAEWATVIEMFKYSRGTAFEAHPYSNLVMCGQTVTSVRTTRKPVPALIPEIAERRFLFSRNLVEVARELETTRPVHFETKMARKVWELCNPNPCDMKKCYIEADPCKSISMFHVQQKNDPVWSWYDYIWKGDIAKYALIKRLPLQRYSGLSAESERFRNLAITKAYATAKSPILPIQVYLGELGETLEMLISPLSAIRKLLTKGVPGSRMYKTRLKPFKDLVETGGGTWLEFRYGWMPLIYQVEDIIDSFNHKINSGFPIHVVRGGSHLLKNRSEQYVRGVNLCASLQLEMIEEIQSTIRGTAVLATRQRMSRDKFYGNRWSDLLSTAHELKSLSFVWDWFINIGDWLQAIVPDPDLTVIANSVSVKRGYTHRVKPTVLGISRLTTTPCRRSDVAGLLGEASYQEYSLVRNVNFTLPNVPVLRKQWLSLARTADALSLITGKIINLLK